MLNVSVQDTGMLDTGTYDLCTLTACPAVQLPVHCLEGYQCSFRSGRQVASLPLGDAAMLRDMFLREDIGLQSDLIVAPLDPPVPSFSL